MNFIIKQRMEELHDHKNETGNGRITSKIIDVIPSKKMGISIESSKSYIYQIDLAPYKNYNIIKLEGYFRIIYKNANNESVSKNIIKSINM